MRVTLSIPEKVVKKFYSIVSPRRRSQIITELIKKEIQQRETLLESICMAANADEILQKDIDDWQSFEGLLAE